ncbi:hypothetical protein ACFXK0_18070 [Nocardia sp. NPDC059177]|uniref:hypothetical protein n=1 Tax=Nocardia sp. NPDC059177 TaxID=3346759 RepID=UPI00369C9C02
MTDDPSSPGSWAEVLTAMTHPADPEPTVHGVLTCLDDNGPVPVGFTAFEPVTPTYLGAIEPGRTRWRVWRDGARVRIENAAGEPVLICDGTWVWRFDGDPAPLRDNASTVHYFGSAARLLLRRSPNEFAGDDFTTPTGPVGVTTFLGRPAWTVELAPPPRKPYPIQLVVDRATGIVLQQRSDSAGTVLDEWSELTVGAELDDALFGWAGPVRTRADEQQRLRARREAEAEAQREWFARTVTREPLSIEARFEIAVETVYRHDDRTGAFEASLRGFPNHAMLARRPQSALSWELGWSGHVERWTDGGYDWALRIDGVSPTPESLARFRRQLSGNPA